MTITITTMADHSRRRLKLPPSAAHKALRPAPSSSLDGRRLPEQADMIFNSFTTSGAYAPAYKLSFVIAYNLFTFCLLTTFDS
jgi:hypothetical protein